MPPWLAGFSYNCRVVSCQANRVVGLTALLAAVVAAAQTMTAPQRTDRVTAVRFGVIDPPVVRQVDITVDAPTSNQRRDPAPLERCPRSHEFRSPRPAAASS